MAFELNLEGGAEVLKELVADEIAALAQQIAGDAGDGAKVKTYTTDRAAATVSVPAEAQAKDGVLTRAASAAGLEVKLRPEKPRKARPRKNRKGAAGGAASDS
ncbi:hypothetical protein A5733_17715 [Mycobacterium sp. NS-7484]|uniref:hypothetical protein n=1 Tax=Mycobacterium sp. NS-7484 TaxID=1834161 RepID=UPI00096EEC0F|nr:hypothetical protein [Mycobacterium sp. NS-7484]OMB92485.1 hypothetical protein A5733_17715 [Mycobacterium sp. NS-7484]